jgi:hypothetical protein
MAADLDASATVELLIDFGDIVALLGALEWTSFVTAIARTRGTPTKLVSSAARFP